MTDLVLEISDIVGWCNIKVKFESIGFFINCETTKFDLVCFLD